MQTFPAGARPASMEAQTCVDDATHKRRRWRGWGKIRIHIAMYVLLAGSVILILGLLLTNMIGMQTVRQTIGANFQGIARLAANRAEDILTGNLRRLNDLSLNLNIVSAASMARTFYANVNDAWIQKYISEREKGWQNGPDKQDIEVLESDIAKYLQTIGILQKDTVLGICIVDQQGALLAASTRPLHFDLHSTPWWRMVKKQGKAYVSSIMDKSTTFPSLGDVVEMAMPIRSSGKTIGAVYVAFKSSGLFLSLREIRIGHTGHVMLVDSLGTPLLCDLLPHKAHAIHPSLLRTISASRPGWGVVADDAHGGHNSIIGFAPVRIPEQYRLNMAGGRQWYTFVRQDPLETYAWIHALMWKIGWLGTALVLMLALAGMYGGVRIERPVRALQEGARRIGAGDLHHRIHIDSSDEIGVLAREFNSMADNILETQQELANFANAVIHAGDAIIMTDADANIFYANPAFEQLSGYKAEEVLGKKPSLWKSGRTPGHVYQDMWSTVQAGMVWAGELTNKKKNGTLYIAQMTISPILSEEGEIVSLLGVQRDITQQRAMEAELRRHHDELELLVEERAREIKQAKDQLEGLLANANDAIFTLDEHGCFTFVNTRMEAWGYKSGDIVGRPFSVLLSKRDAVCAQDCDVGCQSPELQQGRFSSTEIREFCIRTRQDERREVMVSVSDLADGSTLVIARDMTEIKQLQRRVASAEKMRAIGEMATMLVHDFRNPLSTVKMNLQILSLKLKVDNTEEREHFELALNEISTLEHLLSSVLDFAKPMPMDFVWHDLHAQLNEVLHSFGAALAEGGIELEKCFNAISCEVRVDREKIRQVWTNLISNAIQAMQGGGRLTVSSANEWHANAPWVVVHIRDNGCGISKDIRQRIFDPFFTMRSGGTGLGLAIVKKIVDAHHGRISVTSQSGQGTTLSVALQVQHISRAELTDTLEMGEGLASRTA